MADLSPAAQAVLDAFFKDADEDATLRLFQGHLADAIRAAADQVVPEENVDDADYHSLCAKWAAEGKQEVRDEILALAAELRGA